LYDNGEDAFDQTGAERKRNHAGHPIASLRCLLMRRI